MPEISFGAVCLSCGLSHKSALIAWGAFYFKTRSDTDAVEKLVDDEDLRVDPPARAVTDRLPIRSRMDRPRSRSMTIRRPWSPRPSPTPTNHCGSLDWRPIRVYDLLRHGQARVVGAGVRWDWDPQTQGAEYSAASGLPPRVPDAAGSDGAAAGPVLFHRHRRFRASGSASRPRRPGSSSEKWRRRSQRAVDEFDVRLILTTGDNIYASKRFLLWTGESATKTTTGSSRTSSRTVTCSIGSRSVRRSAITTAERQRSTTIANRSWTTCTWRERLAGEEAAGRASVDPGLFYRFRVSADVEFVCVDTSKEDFFRPDGSSSIRSTGIFIDRTFPAAESNWSSWRIPFGHHPPFCAGPQHHNTHGMERADRRCSNAVAYGRMFSGHEHNFQHSTFGSVNYFVTGGGARRAGEDPRETVEAHTVSWADACHFLLVTIDGNAMDVRVIGPGSAVTDVDRTIVTGGHEAGPIRVVAE